MRVGVVGAGTMGSGICQVFAVAGHEASLFDVDPGRVAAAVVGIERHLARSVERGRTTREEANAALARIHRADALAVLGDRDLVVEAIVEDVSAKVALLAELDTICRPETILASNTSSISITRLASATARPGQVIGMHFMNPAPVMPLVEVVRGQRTSDATTTTIVELARQLGKTPVEVNDFPGFVSNRLLMPMLNEAAYALMEGVATREAIDIVMKLGMNHPMGPLQLADLIGLDVCLQVMETLHQGFGDPKYRPCPLLRRMVQAGYLGRKSGRGFYEYS
ncbi:MAG: 3-hydroxybutyryl-CoA dehydrogenase [Chloroflexi bacterium]|nr:3-hydroxybutyryl-CoA dehydrogenase [Chloroflexota bacterium]